MRNSGKRASTVGVLIIALALVAAKADAVSIGSRGHLSGWIGFNDAGETGIHLGVRYVPELFIETSFGENYTIDADISVNTYGRSVLSEGDVDASGELKLYRLWIRMTSVQMEARLGLQKINFGPATLFRPLMWFDRIDPRDPLEMTEGVYGFLMRYYFLNNVNVWAWGLYDNEETKGWEIAPTAEGKVEWGGRVQLPVFQGEMGISYHRRKADTGALPLLTEKEISEQRFGIDGRWDIETGMWFEASWTRWDVEWDMLRYRRMVTLGIDYTFNIGNGLYGLGEYLTAASAEDPFQSRLKSELTGIMLNYPLGLLDSVTGMFYYDWDNRDRYNFLRWERIYDHWGLHFMAFWNPEDSVMQMAPYQPENGFDASNGGLMRGKGMQIMLVLNH